MVHGMLSDGRELTLAGMLGELVSAGRQDLSNLATRAEAEVELVTNGDSERVTRKFQDVCETLLAYHREKEVRVVRERLFGADATSGDAASAPGETDSSKENALRRVIEFHRANPNRGRISRPRN